MFSCFMRHINTITPKNIEQRKIILYPGIFVQKLISFPSPFPLPPLSVEVSLVILTSTTFIFPRVSFA